MLHLCLTPSQGRHGSKGTHWESVLVSELSTVSGTCYLLSDITATPGDPSLKGEVH